MNVVMKFCAVLSLTASATGASAAGVMIKGSNSNSDIATFLTANGHTLVADSEDYAGVDTVILLRTDGTAALSAFIQSGGILVTEWSGADWAMANLLGGTVSGGGFIGTGTTVTFTAAGAAAGLSNGIGTSYSAGASSEFFRTFTNLGTGSVLATRNGGIAAIVGGAAGSGYVVANGSDWADSFAASGTANGQLLLNSLMAGGSGAVPEPATWAMMLGGFGLAGAALRRRRQVVRVTYA